VLNGSVPPKDKRPSECLNLHFLDEYPHAELQLITGHARRETLAICQHVALDGDLERKYQDTMKQLDL
jgi:hypothetical protein